MAKRFVKVATRGELAPGKIKGVEADGERIALCNVDGRFFAIRDECTHQQFPLSAGQIDDARLTCSLHGAQFDVETGAVLGPPAMEPVETYEVKVDGEDILIGLE